MWKSTEYVNAAIPDNVSVRVISSNLIGTNKIVESKRIWMCKEICVKKEMERGTGNSFITLCFKNRRPIKDLLFTGSDCECKDSLSLSSMLIKRPSLEIIGHFFSMYHLAIAHSVGQWYLSSMYNLLRRYKMWVHV